MFIEDIKNDFYNVLLGKRVLLLVHYDIDAVCTCKILQNLFKSDNISYTLVPVGGISELKTAYEENSEEIKYVVLVNCGGTIDLVDILQPEEDVIFFVLDSHKPTDVCNVYSDGQVRLLYKDEEEDIPNFDDIFRDDEEEEDVPLESGREALEAAVERRRERKAWEEKRHTLMFNYTQFSYYGRPSACCALELSWRVSRREVSGVWAACAALAGAALLHARSPAALVLDAAGMQAHVATEAEDDHRPHIVVEKDLWLPLYRRWSLEAALRHAPDVAPALRLHTRAGDQRLRHLLADIGIPLQQARQAYLTMDVELRRSLVPSLEGAAGRLGLPAPARAAFLLRRPHAPPRPALDQAVVILAFLEHDTLPRAEGFERALESLSLEHGELSAGCAAATRALARVARLLPAAPPVRAGPYRHLLLPDGVPEVSSLRGPLWLGVAARWAATGTPLPLVASVARDDDTCLLLGVPPRFQHEPRNLFGAAFEQAAMKSGTSVSLDFFDTSVITLPISQRPQFLDALTALLG